MIIHGRSGGGGDAYAHAWHRLMLHMLKHHGIDRGRALILAARASFRLHGGEDD